MAFNGHKIYIQSFDGQKEEWLTCLNEDSFQVDWQVSSSFQVSFTAYLNDHDGVSFDMLENDTYIVFEANAIKSSRVYLNTLMTLLLKMSLPHMRSSIFRISDNSRSIREVKAILLIQC